jgi:hypothetical protein
VNGSKQKKSKRRRQVQYGIIIPVDVEVAFWRDAENGITDEWTKANRRKGWHLSLHLTVLSFTPQAIIQVLIRLKMMYEVKNDGQMQTRMVVWGHTVDPRGLSTRSMIVKGISIRFLDLAADRDGLKTM